MCVFVVCIKLLMGLNPRGSVSLCGMRVVLKRELCLGCPPQRQISTSYLTLPLLSVLFAKTINCANLFFFKSFVSGILCINIYSRAICILAGIMNGWIHGFLRYDFLIQLSYHTVK